MNEAAVIIGASNGLGKALAYKLASQGVDCILASRNFTELSVIAADLTEVYKVSAKVLPVDMKEMNENSAREFVIECFSLFNSITQVYLTAAVVYDQDNGFEAASVLQPISAVNYLGAAFIISAFSDKMKNTSSTIVVISSIAAIRPRGNNIAYTASKIALEYYVRGLQHFLAASPLRLQIYRVGYMDTGMSQGKKLLFKKADSSKVAGHIIKNRKRKKRLSYYPAYWRIIAMALKQVPWFIYKKLKF